MLDIIRFSLSRYVDTFTPLFELHNHVNIRLHQNYFDNSSCFDPFTLPCLIALKSMRTIYVYVANLIITCAIMNILFKFQMNLSSNLSVYIKLCTQRLYHIIYIASLNVSLFFFLFRQQTY